jgi:hypothetical protein
MSKFLKYPFYFSLGKEIKEYKDVNIDQDLTKFTKIPTLEFLNIYIYGYFKIFYRS